MAALEGRGLGRPGATGGGRDPCGTGGSAACSAGSSRGLWPARWKCAFQGGQVGQGGPARRRRGCSVDARKAAALGWRTTDDEPSLRQTPGSEEGARTPFRVGESASQIDRLVSAPAGDLGLVEDRRQGRRPVKRSKTPSFDLAIRVLYAEADVACRRDAAACISGGATCLSSWRTRGKALAQTMLNLASRELSAVFTERGHAMCKGTLRRFFRRRAMVRHRSEDPGERIKGKEHVARVRAVAARRPEAPSCALRRPVGHAAQPPRLPRRNRGRDPLGPHTSAPAGATSVLVWFLSGAGGQRPSWSS